MIFVCRTDFLSIKRVWCSLMNLKICYYNMPVEWLKKLIFLQWKARIRLCLWYRSLSFSKNSSKISKWLKNLTQRINSVPNKRLHSGRTLTNQHQTLNVPQTYTEKILKKRLMIKPIPYLKMMMEVFNLLFNIILELKALSQWRMKNPVQPKRNIFKINKIKWSWVDRKEPVSTVSLKIKNNIWI